MINTDDHHFVIHRFKKKERYMIKKTYGHKYYVAASLGFEEKSYPFIRKMK